MAVKIVIYDTQIDGIIMMVKDLKKQGLIQHVDFDFSYHPSKWDTFGHEAPTRRLTEFTFYKEKYATLFSIKYSDWGSK